MAEQYHDEGFSNVKALRGGVEAWKKAGYGTLEADDADADADADA